MMKSNKWFSRVMALIAITLISYSLGFCDNGATRLNQKAAERTTVVNYATINDSMAYVDLHPDLAIHSAMGIPFEYLFVIKEAEEAFGRTFHEYRKKRNKELVIGGTIIALGLAGYVYTFEVLPTPVRHDPWTAEYSEDKYNTDKTNRWIAFGASTAITVVGTFIFVRAFRWDSRITGEAGVNYLRLRFLLSRPSNTHAFDGVRRKELRTFGYYPRYR